MKSKKVKIQKTLESSQIAAFLRLLASEIEGKSDEGLKEYGVDLHNFNKLKVGLVKREGGQLHLKLKVKDIIASEAGSKVETEFEDIAALKYKPLKKQMAKTFKEIGQASDNSQMPSEAVVRRFLAEAEQMVSFSGFGDEYYDKFMAECLLLKEKCMGDDSEGLGHQYKKITMLKKQCHRRYK